MEMDYINWRIKIEGDIQKRREKNGRKKEFQVRRTRQRVLNVTKSWRTQQRRDFQAGRDTRSRRIRMRNL
jgi:hypothetical protein